MPFYMVQIKVPTTTWKTLMSKPQDRTGPVAELCEAHGAKLHHYFFAFGEHDIVLIAETPDDKTAMALAMGVAASGVVSSVQTTVFVTAAEAVDVMRRAGELAGTYRPPNAS